MAVKTKFYIDQFVNKLDKDINAKLHETEDLLVSNIKSETPVVSGRLKKSIEGDTSEIDKRAATGTDVPYAIHVEDGTRKMSPRFFMTKGYRNSIATIKKIFSRKMN